MSTNNSYKKVLNIAKSLIMNNYGYISLKTLRLFCSFFAIFNFANPSLSAQTALNEYISPALKTLQFHRSNWPLSYPVIRLNSDQQLTLSFDELGSSTKNYQYTIVHCDADWIPSRLMPTDYISGNPINPILDYSYSFNTTIDYVHYSLSFPNQSISPLISGNYMLLVFEGFDYEQPVLRKKFMVNEPMVTIIPYIRNRMHGLTTASMQEINFEIQHEGFSISNPNEEISVSILQNGRTDNAITGLKPRFFSADLMGFNFTRETEMEGGNEFRYIDIRSTRFFSDRVEDIQYVDPYFHITVVPDYSRNPSSYQYRQDLNGRYYIEVDDKDNDELEADYLFVHFRLYSERPLLSKKIFLNGALTDWQLNKSSEMSYDPSINAYRKSLLLKQGYYNYQFLALEQGESSAELFPLENSFYETENDYLILVYYKNLTDRSHRLIGAELINSVRRD